MKEFMKKHDIWLRLLAILLAFILWIIARDYNNPHVNYTLTDIPVTIIGADDLLSSSNLTVIEYTSSVDVRVYGNLDQVTSTTLRDRITVSVDVSQITDGAGEYALEPVINTGYTVGSSVEGVSTSPERVRVLVDEVTSTTVPVRVETSGTPADGYRAGTPEPTSTKEITVEGPASELAEIRYAYGTVDVSGRTSTFTNECQIQLVNDAGDPITGTHVTSQTDTVTVRVPI